MYENGEALIPALKDETRYQSVKNDTSVRQAALVEALLLSQQFRDIHKEVVTWLDRCEENFRKLDDESVAELQQERIKVIFFCFTEIFPLSLKPLDSKKARSRVWKVPVVQLARGSAILRHFISLVSIHAPGGRRGPRDSKVPCVGAQHQRVNHYLNASYLFSISLLH